MRRVLVPFLVLPAGCVGAGTPAAPTPPAPASVTYFYACNDTRSDEFGTLAIDVRVSEDGARRDYAGHWASTRHPDGILFRYDWNDTSIQPVIARMHVNLSFTGRWPRHRRVRLELRSASRGSDPWDMVFAGEYSRAQDQVWSTTSLAELRAIAGGAPLVAAVVTEDGHILAQDRIDPRLFESPVAATEAIRPEMEAMVADYRNRCQRQEDYGESVVVT